VNNLYTRILTKLIPNNNFPILFLYILSVTKPCALAEHPSDWILIRLKSHINESPFFIELFHYFSKSLPETVEKQECHHTPYSKVAAILVFFCLPSNYPLFLTLKLLVFSLEWGNKGLSASKQMNIKMAAILE